MNEKLVKDLYTKEEVLEILKRKDTEIEKLKSQIEILSRSLDQYCEFGGYY